MVFRSGKAKKDMINFFAPSSEDEEEEESNLSHARTYYRIYHNNCNPAKNKRIFVHLMIE